MINPNYFEKADRRRNAFGMSISDAEQEMIFAEMTARNMSAAEFMRAAIEAYTGKTIFRETRMCGGRLKFLKEHPAKMEVD